MRGTKNHDSDDAFRKRFDRTGNSDTNPRASLSKGIAAALAVMFVVAMVFWAVQEESNLKEAQLNAAAALAAQAERAAEAERAAAEEPALLLDNSENVRIEGLGIYGDVGIRDSKGIEFQDSVIDPQGKTLPKDPPPN